MGDEQICASVMLSRTIHRILVSVSSSRHSRDSLFNLPLMRSDGCRSYGCWTSHSRDGVLYLSESLTIIELVASIMNALYVRRRILHLHQPHQPYSEYRPVGGILTQLQKRRLASFLSPGLSWSHSWPGRIPRQSSAVLVRSRCILPYSRTAYTRSTVTSMAGNLCDSLGMGRRGQIL